MHGGGSSSDGRKRARIEIIPLIDVIFFLLATFVLFTLSLSKSNGLQVRQPDSSTGIARDPNGTHTITVLPEGALAWDKEPVDFNQFLNRLTTYHATDPEGRILINADANAKFYAVIYAMDEARKAQFTKVYVETRSKPVSQ